MRRHCGLAPCARKGRRERANAKGRVPLRPSLSSSLAAQVFTSVGRPRICLRTEVVKDNYVRYMMIDMSLSQHTNTCGSMCPLMW